MLASLLAPQAASRPQAVKADPNASYSYRILDNPTTGDAFGFRGAIQQNAQGLSDKLFHSLASLLGGAAPTLNFVPTGSQFAPTNLSANLTDRVGAPKGQVNVDPLATEALTNFRSPYHDSGTNAFPHEFSHLSQTSDVTRSSPLAEGGAQAFADYVTPSAARTAHIPYNLGEPGQYDGAYADYVKAAQAKGLAWILAGQFGKPGTPAFP
jgi:hypothetical protein